MERLVDDLTDGQQGRELESVDSGSHASGLARAMPQLWMIKIELNQAAKILPTSQHATKMS
jgi:hypothetical protein